MSVQSTVNTSFASLFTDALGQVVFVDHSFLRLMQYPTAGKVAGEPLHRALRMEQKLANQLLNDLRAAGHIRDRQLDLRLEQGTTMRVLLNGVATYDDSGTFLGADVTLRDVKRATSEVRAITAGELLQSRVQEILDEAAQAAEAESLDYLNLYFTAQMDALHVLVVRLMGLWASDEMDAALNARAEQHNWGVMFRDGLFHRVFAENDATMYRTLMAEAQHYAIHLIGERVVAREVASVNSHMDARVLDAAIAAGLTT